MRLLTLTFATCLFLSGCANKFSDSYYGMPPEQIQTGVATLPCSEAVMRSLPDIPLADIENNLFEEGYVVVGTSTFTADPSSSMVDDAMSQGRKLGACLVLFGQQYSHTLAGVRTVSYPYPTFGFGYGYGGHRGRSRGYGFGGTSFAFGGTGYTPYISTQYIYRAVYAVQARKQGPLGIRMAEAPESYRKLYDTSSGGLVTAVAKGSSARKANILRGDIIMAINGEPVDPENMAQLLVHGQVNKVKIYRDGKVHVKDIQIE